MSIFSICVLCFKRCLVSECLLAPSKPVFCQADIAPKSKISNIGGNMFNFEISISNGVIVIFIVQLFSPGKKSLIIC